MKVRLQFPIPIGVRGVSPLEYVMIRDLRPDELMELAEAEPDVVLARICGLSPDAVSRLTAVDRANIIAARAAARVAA